MGRKSKKLTMGTTDCKSGDMWEKRGYFCGIVVLFFVVSYVHFHHINFLFENDTHFSHLSDLEREFTFRTEKGLYYSYYKRMAVEAPTFLSGLTSIMNDNLTEYPDTINTLKRFNLYPEVILAGTYRVFIGITEHFKWQTKICYTINRGEALSPAYSCEGIGDPMYFYTYNVLALNGFLLGLLFLHSVLLSGTVFGGLLTVTAYFFNHSESTRIMWSVSLREAHGYPVFVFQMLCVLLLIQGRCHQRLLGVLIAASVALFVASWQFAQFILFTQLVSMTGVYTLHMLSKSDMLVYMWSITLGYIAGFLLLFGNEMLLTSVFASSLVTVWTIVAFQDTIDSRLSSIPSFLVKLFYGACCSIVIKLFTSSVLAAKDDAHIYDIFRSKFGSYQDFHTQLYTCAREFDFMELELVQKLTATGLSIASLVVFLVFALKLLCHLWKLTKGGEYLQPGYVPTSIREDRNSDSCDLVYTAFQLFFFTLLAMLIMRLKLFWTPMLAVMCGLLVSTRLYDGVYSYVRPLFRTYNHTLLKVVPSGAIIALMAVQGWSNVAKQLEKRGEFLHLDQEVLYEWILKETPQDSVFAGAMPTMANVLLSTRRPIVNHPHYEDAGLRDRTVKVYSMFSRKPVKEVHGILTDMGVDLIILETGWCQERERGCGIPNIFNIIDPQNAASKPVCLELMTGPAPFTLVFQNDSFTVLAVNNKKKRKLNLR